MKSLGILCAYKINNGMEIVTIADIPSSGSGLASSSALTVGLVNLLNRYKNKKISKKYGRANLFN